MSTPISISASPMPVYLLPQTGSNAATPGIGVPGTPNTSGLKAVSNNTNFRQSLNEISSMCDALELEAEAAFDSVEHAFDGTRHPDQLIAFLNSLEALKQRLIVTGVGALPVLDPTSIPTPADLDLTTVAERRVKETQATFAASLRVQEGAQAIHDVLAR